VAVKIERWDPQFCPAELSTLYDFLSDDCELPEDDEYYIITKKEFTELEAYNTGEYGYFHSDDDDGIERIAHFASMLERIRDLKDDDVLEINLNNAA